jgi:hypothetical protein
MEIPQDVLILIKEFSKPISRPDWRQGCFFKINYHLYNYLIRMIYREYKIRKISSNWYTYFHFLMD